MHTARVTTPSLPDALLLAEPGELPDDLHPRVRGLVHPVWSSEGLPPYQDDLAKFEVVITSNRPLGAVELDRLPRLRLVVATGTALDYIDEAECDRRGIVVRNTPGYTGSAVAEHAFALLLASARHMCAIDAAVRAGCIDTSDYVGTELAGKTAGIIGLGDIGSRLARLADAFDMEVLFVNRSRRTRPGATQVELPELLARADAVFLTLPLTPETTHLIGASQFEAMKPSAILVNVSADELVDPVALDTALRRRTINAAALDVISSPEPYRDTPHLTLTRVNAWYTSECVRRRAETWLGTLERCLVAE